MALRWKKVQGYNRQVSAVIAANTLLTNPVLIFSDAPSNNLITRITHLATYAFDQAAFIYCTWLTPWFPYNKITDQIGQQWQPLELNQKPEVSAGQMMNFFGANVDGAAHTIGFVIKGEQGYYEDVP